MKNILYLDDWINFYNKKLNRIIIFKPYKNTLEKGIIIDRDKFIKCFNKLLEKNKLRRSLLQENIYVIVNNLYNKEFKRILVETLNELNYNKVYFIKESSVLNYNNNNTYINYNESFFIMSYVKEKRITDAYQNNSLNHELLTKIVNKDHNNKPYIYGKLAKKLSEKKENIYIYSDYKNVVINSLINKISKEK